MRSVPNWPWFKGYAMTHQKESAGGYDTTAADTKIASETIALTARVKQVAIRLASMLAVMFRGFV